MADPITPSGARRPTGRRALVIVLVLGLAVQVPNASAFAIKDAAAIVQRVAHIANQAKLIIEWYLKISLMIQQCRRLKNLPARYRASYLASWRHAAPRDAYGLAAGWSQALNDGDVNAIAAAQERISYDSGIHGLSSGDRRGFGNGQPEVQNTAVSVDLIDNSVRESMRAVGTYRKETEQLDREITELQHDLTLEGLTRSGGGQERDAILQKAAIGAMLVAAQGRYTNRLLGAAIEDQALATQGLRDQNARGLRAAVYGLKARPSLWLFTQNPDIRTSVRF